MGLFSLSNKKIEQSLKTKLKLTTHRINLMKNKKTNSIKIQKRQVADLLKADKNESARIKVENVIRDDYCLEAYDILLLFCELLHSRSQLLMESKECPFDLKEAVTTLIYSAPRIDIPELTDVRKLLKSKFGKTFVAEAMENKGLSVNQRVIYKLGIQVPKPYLCVQYLKQIAEENGIEWEDDDGVEEAKNLDDNPDMNYTQATTGAGLPTHGFSQTQETPYPTDDIYPNSHNPPPYSQNVFSSVPSHQDSNYISNSNSFSSNPVHFSSNLVHGNSSFNNQMKSNTVPTQSMNYQEEDDEEDDLAKRLAAFKVGGSTIDNDSPPTEDIHYSLNSNDNFSNVPQNDDNSFNSFHSHPDNFNQQEENSFSSIPKQETPSNKVEYDFDLLQQRFNQLKDNH